MCRFHPYNNIHYTINTHCHSTLALEICFCYCCIYVGQQRAEAFNSAHCVRLFIIIMRIAIEGASSPLLTTSKRVWAESDLSTYITFTYFTWLVCMNSNEKAWKRRQKKKEFSSMNNKKKKQTRKCLTLYRKWCTISVVKIPARSRKLLYVGLSLECPSELGDSVWAFFLLKPIWVKSNE